MLAIQILWGCSEINLLFTLYWTAMRVWYLCVPQNTCIFELPAHGYLLQNYMWLWEHCVLHLYVLYGAGCTWSCVMLCIFVLHATCWYLTNDPKPQNSLTYGLIFKVCNVCIYFVSSLSLFIYFSSFQCFYSISNKQNKVLDLQPILVYLCFLFAMLLWCY